MRHLILGLLLVQPCTLYDLHGRFAAGLSHIYAASYGSIHRALHQLHTSGDVAVVDAPDATRGKKQYSATAQGRQTWAAWMKEPRHTEDSEVTMLARVFLLDLLEDPADRYDVLHALHRRALADLEELGSLAAAMSRVESVTMPPRPPDTYPGAALDYGLRTAEHAVNWLEGLLEGASAEPVSERIEDRVEGGR